MRIERKYLLSGNIYCEKDLCDLPNSLLFCFCFFITTADTWVEITNVANYTQYGGALSVSDVPDPIPPPYSLSATDFAAPANAGTCFSRSPGVPSNCTENCLYYPEIFGYEWLLFGTLFCSGTYPKSESDSSSGSNLEAVSEPGVVTAVLTKQCKDYNYEPPWMAVVTDQWGGKWVRIGTQNCRHKLRIFYFIEI